MVYVVEWHEKEVEVMWLRARFLHEHKRYTEVAPHRGGNGTASSLLVRMDTARARAQTSQSTRSTSTACSAELRGWVKSTGDYERLVERVWAMYAKEVSFRMTQEQESASKWNIDGYGCGKAEGDVKEDGFKLPEVCWIVKPGLLVL